MRRSRPQVGGRAWLPAMLATLAAPLLLYFIVRTTASALASPAAVPLAALPPADFLPLVRGLARIAPHPDFRVTEDMAEASRSAAIANPLSYEPFFVLAKERLQAGKKAEAIHFLEEARLRRASHLPTRMYLLLSYSQVGRYPEALAEMDVVLRLSEAARGALVPELAKLLTTPAGREALAAALARDPSWREEFIRVAGRQKIEPEHAEALLNRVRALKRGGDVSLEQELFLKSLVGAGDYRRARKIWLNMLPPNVRARNAMLFDGSFRGLRAPAPFGWTLNDVDVGRAEIVRDEGRSYLDVTYFGGRNVVLAEQVLSLTPGTYQLRLLAKYAEGAKPARLGWRILCLPDAQELAAISLENIGMRFAPVTKPFTVPANGCEGQKLLLMAEAGDVASVSNLQVAEVDITR